VQERGRLNVKGKGCNTKDTEIRGAEGSEEAKARRRYFEELYKQQASSMD